MREYSVEIRGKPHGVKVKCGGVTEDFTSISNAVNFNPLKTDDPYRGRTAPLTSKRCILHIYSTNIGTEYFKHGVDTLRFFFLFKMQFVS